MNIDKALAELSRLYADMDAAYAKRAGAIGLTCQGCTDTCCRTHFHHHTVLERVHLEAGLGGLAGDLRADLIERARTYQAEVRRAQADGRVVRAACPLLKDDRCVLYDHRPMICRLHGVPWVLHQGRLAGRVQPGCDRAMQRLANAPPPPPLDRTVFYAKLAELERVARRLTAQKNPVKFTVAELIRQFARKESR